MGIQCSLTVGAPDDPLEHEADAMADTVMRMPNVSDTFSGSSFLQRKCAACEEEEKAQRKPLSASITPFIQTKTNGEGTTSASLSSKINSSRGSGSSMDNGTKTFMESRFGSDFSSVKIHTGSESVMMNRELSAKAFTVGNDIYFNEGQYNPQSDSGKHLLAHELTHTIQQGKAPSVQRSCTDGRCDTCAGGRKRIRLTGFFRVRATRANMVQVRREINEAKNVLRNCCVDLSVFFDWRLLRGGGVFNDGSARADGTWDYPDEATQLGDGNTFSGATGIPMLFVNEVTGSGIGGGTTVTHDFDPQYNGARYIVIGLNQPHANPQSSIAHELGHFAGILPHSRAANNIMGGAGENVDEPYCNAIRNIAT